MSGKAVTRLPPNQRAGSHLDLAMCAQVWTVRHGKRVLAGMIDRSQRLFQHGGSLNDFVWWKEHLMSLSVDVWIRVDQECDWIEVIDHRKNVCYRISVDQARALGKRYQVGTEYRYGVPLQAWAKVPGPEVAE